ncbi:MAG: hypothetical protein KC486_34185 [Myxococcales bacterium]|nr:hypothetical protein [Myxococcales bacterium]
MVHEDDRDLLRLSSPGDGVGLTITVNDAGIAIHLSGADVVLRANGRLAIDARELALHSREGLVLSSDADAAIQVRGDLHSEARIQRIRARLGDVDISANDDVHLRGEQIKLNT